MVEPIGKLVSECFYDGRLESAPKPLDTNLNLGFLFPRPVTWFTTAGLPNRWEHSVDASFVNYCEVEFLHDLLGRINWTADQCEVRYKVALITGYAGQRKELWRSIVNDIKKWQRLVIECNTVDAFQGREADIALYSVTRCNDHGGIGFLYEKERINVALSRGKYYLGIIGDHLFCRQAQGDNPFRAVLSHIDADPEGCKLEEIRK
jgi:superfamily I DNA and/or RNA helicase